MTSGPKRLTGGLSEVTVSRPGDFSATRTTALRISDGGCVPLSALMGVSVSSDAARGGS
jgi:hypothetical protein